MPAETPGDSAGAVLRSAIESTLQLYALPGQPLCLALSGGRDSVVLLHVLRAWADGHPLRAIHVDHGLHADSALWSQTCVTLCAQLGVELQVCKVVVARDSGQGIEAAAREARYAAIAEHLARDELLLTAHHRNDQVETLLLQLLRGAGVHGIAGMPVHVRRAGIDIIRPLLAVAGATIRDYANARKLRWCEDPSNADLGLDRNYLRREILPRLEGRWPAAGKAVARTARLAGEAAAVLDEVADDDLAKLLEGNRLDLVGLQRLSAVRQRNAFRRALRRLSLPVPAERQLILALTTMSAARADAQPLIAWPGVRLHRYRESLWLYAESQDPAGLSSGPARYRWNPQTELDLGGARGRLRAEPCRGQGIVLPPSGGEFIVCFRKGGERIRPAAAAATRDLKKLLQENHIVPWMRGHIPLIWLDDQLAAVGDLWTHADCAAGPGEPGVRIVWSAHAAIR